MARKSFLELHAQAVKEMRMDEAWFGLGGNKDPNMVPLAKVPPQEVVMDLLNSDRLKKYVDMVTNQLAQRVFANDHMGKVKATKILADAILKRAKGTSEAAFEAAFKDIAREHLRDPDLFNRVDADAAEIERRLSQDSGMRGGKDVVPTAGGRLRPTGGGVPGFSVRPRG